jgi:hypothetical protein
MDESRTTRLEALGWALLVVAFAAAVALDPWSLSERDPEVLRGSPRMMARHAQAVVLGMAFLQLMVAEILTEASLSRRMRAVAALLSGGGALVYAAGYGLVLLDRSFAWLAVAGAALNFLAFALLLAACWRSAPLVWRIVLAVFCGGMLLDVAMGLFAVDPDRFLPGYLGREDELRLRMLRLARAAVIALSLLTLRFRRLAGRRDGAAWRWGQGLLLFGAVSMPLTLALAAFTAADLKYLLPLPSQAAFWGAVVAFCLAGPPARRLERAGWGLVVLGMGAGLLMGLYAFDGPIPPPSFLGRYNDFGRRLSRLGHAYDIVLGLACIVLAGRFARTGRTAGAARLGVPVLAAGAALTVLGTVVEAAAGGPTLLLSVGPAVVAVGLLLSLLGARDGSSATVPEDRDAPPNRAWPTTPLTKQDPS